MRGNDVLGIIFSNMHDEKIAELTNVRTMGSVPFGGRYRLVDFPLSNMANAGVTKVGIITKRNYQSLMDHVGSGKFWNLSRKSDGLFILPPFGNGNEIYHNRVEALNGILPFIVHSREKYVLLSDSNVVCTTDYQELVRQHIKSGANITAAYKSMRIPEKADTALELTIGSDGFVNEFFIDPETDSPVNLALNIFVMNKDFLVEALKDAVSRDKTDFVRNILKYQIAAHEVFAYELPDYVNVISSMSGYFSANMEMLNGEIRSKIFMDKYPVFTKVRDAVPAKYGLSAVVKNSLVADGCVIEGEVCDSILFRGVKVEKGVTIRNSIIMQSTVVGEESQLSYVIIDKNAVIKNGRTLSGCDTHPVFISKRSEV